MSLNLIWWRIIYIYITFSILVAFFPKPAPIFELVLGSYLRYCEGSRTLKPWVQTVVIRDTF